jgi:gliding motility-associated-like protein
MLKCLLIILICFISFNTFAQTDSVFWFAAPEVINDNNSQHTDRPILLRITAYDKPAFVTITQPANPSFSTINLFVAAKTSLSKDLTYAIDQIESKPANKPINTGLLITSTANITAYYEENSLLNPEMFVLKGDNALGKNFFIPAQNIYNNWGSFTLPTNPPSSSFDIVATEDNTIITIVPANDIVGHNAGVSFNVFLNKGQVYSATATGVLAANHLMGSTVTSNKKIAITIKDDSIGGVGGCLDLAGDQIVPTNLVGTKYITLPGFLNKPVGFPTDHLFLLATQNNTSITINGVFKTMLAQGQTYYEPSMNEVKYVETSLPTYALHLSGFGCEVGHAMLPQIECTGSQKVAFTRSNSTSLYMNILVPAGYENKFIYNGNPNFIRPDSFKIVPHSNGLWMYARIQLDTTQLAVDSAAIIQNTGIEFHLSIIHGDSTGGARYGYFSDFNKLNVATSTNAVNGGICANSDLKFFTDVHNAKGVIYNWKYNNIHFSDSANPVLVNVNTSASGTYELTATKFSCNAIIIPIPITVHPIPLANPTSNSPVCSGNTLRLNSFFAGANYSWVGANGFASNANKMDIQNVTFAATGKYYLTTTANNCTSTDSINVVVNQSPSVGISPTKSILCFNDFVILVNNSLTLGINYLWTLPNGSTSAIANIQINNVTYGDTGKYILTASTNFCSAKDSFVVKVNAKPSANPSSNSPVCSGGVLQLSAVYAGSGLSWTGPNNFTSNKAIDSINNVTINATGKYYVTTTSNNCSTVDTLNVVINPTPIATIKAVHNNACVGDSMLLNNNNTVSNTSYHWVLPNGGNSFNQNIKINSVALSDTGKYYVTVNTPFCSAKDSAMITVRTKPKVVFNALPNVCNNAANVLLTAAETTGVAGFGVFSGLGISNNYFVPSQVGEGTVPIKYSYTANNGCSDTKQQNITVNPTPTITLDDVKVIKKGTSIQLNPFISGSYDNLVWSESNISNSLSSINAINPIATPFVNTTYKILLTTNKGCSAIDSILVRLALPYKISNAFSPNNDYTNDKWIVEDETGETVFNANIFDRYGKVVKTIFGSKIVWDGMYNGNPLPVATYYYVIVARKGNETQNIGGWIQLLR